MSSTIPLSAHPCDTPLLTHAQDPHRDGWTLCRLPVATSLAAGSHDARTSCPVCLDRLHLPGIHAPE